jgi:hypothetical protein
VLRERGIRLGRVELLLDAVSRIVRERTAQQPRKRGAASATSRSRTTTTNVVDAARHRPSQRRHCEEGRIRPLVPVLRRHP